MKELTLAFGLVIFLSPDIFAETQIKGGGNITFMRAGDAEADLLGFYLGIERTLVKDFGIAFRLRKEGGRFLGPDNGYYFSLAGTYRWQPNVLKKIHEDLSTKIHGGYEFALPHVDYNAFKETARVRRWTFKSRERGILVGYPFFGFLTEVPFRKAFFRKRDLVIEVGTQINIASFGIKEAVYSTHLGTFLETIDQKAVRPVPIFYLGLGFRF